MFFCTAAMGAEKGQNGPYDQQNTNTFTSRDKEGKEGFYYLVQCEKLYDTLDKKLTKSILRSAVLCLLTQAIAIDKLWLK